MKQLLTVLTITTIFFSCNGNLYGQKPVEKKDSIPPITNATPLLSIVDYQQLVAYMDEQIPAKWSIIVKQWLEAKLNERITELQKQKKSN